MKFKGINVKNKPQQIESFSHWTPLKKLGGEGFSGTNLTQPNMSVPLGTIKQQGPFRGGIDAEAPGRGHNSKVLGCQCARLQPEGVQPVTRSHQQIFGIERC